MTHYDEVQRIVDITKDRIAKGKTDMNLMILATLQSMLILLAIIADEMGGKADE